MINVICDIKLQRNLRIEEFTMNYLLLYFLIAIVRTVRGCVHKENDGMRNTMSINQQITNMHATVNI